MSRAKKAPRTKAMEMILDDLMALDEMAIEAQKLARARRTPTTTPGTHELISSLPYLHPPALRTDKCYENLPLLRRQSR